MSSSHKTCPLQKQNHHTHQPPLTWTQIPSSPICGEPDLAGWQSQHNPESQGSRTAPVFRKKEQKKFKNGKKSFDMMITGEKNLRTESNSDFYEDHKQNSFYFPIFPTVQHRISQKGPTKGQHLSATEAMQL